MCRGAAGVWAGGGGDGAGEGGGHVNATKACFAILTNKTLTKHKQVSTQ